MRRAPVAAAALLAACPAILLAGSRITIVNTDTAGQGLNDPTPAAPVGGNPGTTLGQQRLNVLNYVATLWGAILDSPVEIRIRANFGSLTCDATSAVLAQAGPIQTVSDFVPSQGFPGPELPATSYPIALANRRAGRGLLSSDDIHVQINSQLGQASCGGFSFYLGLDGQAGSNADLVTVMLHEFTHGFGFLTFVNLASGIETTSQHDLFERYTLDTSTGKLWTEMTNAERAASAINPGKVAWVGPAVTGAVPLIMKGTPTLRVSAPAAVAGSYLIGTASFGPGLTSAGISGPLVAALDPSDAAGSSTFDACSPLTNPSAVAGKIALVDRGNCTFVIKTKNAQAAGAVALLVADNVDGTPPAGLGGSDPTITIPAVRITKADGATLRAALDAGVTVRLFVDDALLAGTDGANHLLLYSPNPLVSGSSIVHWDTSANPGLLMEPALIPDPTHGVDVTLDFLRDIGWYPDTFAREALAPVHRSHAPHKQDPRP
jgi:hypothetical protein